MFCQGKIQRIFIFFFVKASLQLENIKNSVDRRIGQYGIYTECILSYMSCIFYVPGNLPEISDYAYPPEKRNRCLLQRFLGILIHILRSNTDYIIMLGSAAGAMGAGSLMVATTDSVVSRVEATEVAFCRALLVTLAGSRMPASTMLTYTSL